LKHNGSVIVYSALLVQTYHSESTDSHVCLPDSLSL